MRRLAAPAAVLVLSATAALGAASGTDTVLDNGLRVILIPQHANPMIASAVVVGAGVVHEPASASGASHFLEHLLFNGTTTRTQKQLYDEVDRIGAYNNATTREDHTLFLMLSAKESATEALSIQADMLFHSTIPAANFEKERKIVLEELARDRTDPDYDVEAAFRAFAYAGTPIARPVLGTEASLGAISRDEVVRYYHARYVPKNMALVVLGDFETDAMLKTVTTIFGTARGGPAPASARGSWPDPPHDNLITAPVKEGSGRLLAAFPFDADPWDPRAVAADVLLDAASDGPDSPLRRALEARGLKTRDATLALDRRVRPFSTVLFDARLDGADDPSAVLDALADAVHATRAGGAARARLDLYVSRALADAALARDQILYYPMLRSSMILGSPRGFLEREPQAAAAVTDETWDAAAGMLEAGLARLRARATGPGRVAASAHWEPPPAPASKAPAGFLAGTLPNGLRYAVAANDDSDVFAVHVAFAPRSAAEPEGKDGITDLVHRLMARATLVHGPGAFADQLALAGVRLKAYDDPAIPYDDYYSTPEFSWIRAEAPGRSWRETLSLLAEAIRFPRFDDQGIEEARTEMLRIAKRRAGSPRAVAAAALARLLAPGSALARPWAGTDTSLAAITRDDLERCATALATGRRMIVTVVGPVDAEAVVAALAEDFGSLPAGAGWEETKVPPTPPGLHAEASLGKTQAFVALGETLRVAEVDRAPLAIAVAILSDRLAFDLRETRGLAYAVGASVGPFGDAERLELAMGTRPENVEKAVKGLTDGMAAFRDGPAPGADEVARTVAAVRGRALMRRMTRIGQAYEASMDLLRGRGPGASRRAIDALAAVRPDDVRRVARAYLDPGRLARVVVR